MIKYIETVGLGDKLDAYNLCLRFLVSVVTRRHCADVFDSEMVPTFEARSIQMEDFLNAILWFRRFGQVLETPAKAYIDPTYCGGVLVTVTCTL